MGRRQLGLGAEKMLRHGGERGKLSSLTTEGRTVATPAISAVQECEPSITRQSRFQRH